MYRAAILTLALTACAPRTTEIGAEPDSQTSAGADTATATDGADTATATAGTDTASAGTDGTDGAGESGSWPAPIPDLTLVDFQVLDDGGDGVLTPGEGFEVRCRLVNATDTHHLAYPGVAFAVNGAPAGETMWYGLFARSSYEHAWRGIVPPEGIVSVEASEIGLNEATADFDRLVLTF